MRDRSRIEAISGGIFKLEPELLRGRVARGWLRVSFGTQTDSDPLGILGS